MFSVLWYYKIVPSNVDRREEAMPLVGIVLTALLMFQVLILLAFAWALAGIGSLVGLLKYEPEPEKENPIWGPYDSYLAAVERGRKDFPLSL